MVTEQERTDTRRFCGYPAYGAATTGNAGWRFYQQYGEMEFRLLNLSASEEGVLRQHLATLRTLERAVPAAGESLDTDKAASWTRNPHEVVDRVRLLEEWQRRLCGFLGVPPGPALAGGASVPLVV